MCPANVANPPGLFLLLYTQSTSPAYHPIEDANLSLGSSAYETRVRLHMECQLPMSWPT